MNPIEIEGQVRALEVMLYEDRGASVSCAPKRRPTATVASERNNRVNSDSQLQIGAAVSSSETDLLENLRSIVEERYRIKHGRPLTWESGWAWEALAFLECEMRDRYPGTSRHNAPNESHRPGE